MIDVDKNIFFLYRIANLYKIYVANLYKIGNFFILICKKFYFAKLSMFRYLIGMFLTNVCHFLSKKSRCVL